MCPPTPSTPAQFKERRESNFTIWQPWPQDVVEFVKSRGVQQTVFQTLEEAIPETDVLYVTR